MHSVCWTLMCPGGRVPDGLSRAEFVNAIEDGDSRVQPRALKAVSEARGLFPARPREVRNRLR
jgi:hypothetical protein